MSHCVLDWKRGPGPVGTDEKRESKTKACWHGSGVADLHWAEVNIKNGTKGERLGIKSKVRGIRDNFSFRCLDS